MLIDKLFDKDIYAVRSKKSDAKIDTKIKRGDVDFKSSGNDLYAVNGTIINLSCF